jgi:hypothetical protein
VLQFLLFTSKANISVACGRTVVNGKVQRRIFAASVLGCDAVTFADVSEKLTGSIFKIQHIVFD